MNLTQFLATKGQFIKVAFATEKKPSAAHKGRTLKKVTHGVFRAGINFANLMSVKEGIRDGERGEVQPLPWGKWTHFPYLIEHKGQTYVRLYPAVNGRVNVSYFVDGSPVDKDAFNSFLVPSEANRNDPVECFTVKADNIISIGNQAEETIEEAAEAAEAA
jgi:hypothetical protein